MKIRIGPDELLRALAQVQDEEDARALSEMLGFEPFGSRLAEFFDAPAGDAFDVPPERAIDFFRAKGLAATFAWQDAIDRASAAAFVVAKMVDMDLLSQVRASLESALANGTPFADWRREIEPTLRSAGWWGRKPMRDPLTREVVQAQLGSPSRLETIFRTNMQSAYAAGQWEGIEANAADAPYLMYDAVDDFRTRPAHRAWDGLTLPVGASFWRTHYPPNGWNCRCGVIQLSGAELDQMGLVAQEEPRTGRRTRWTNPRTGRTEMVPRGIDPGFASNAGVDYQQRLVALAEEKAQALPDDLARASRRALADAPAVKPRAAKR